MNEARLTMNVSIQRASFLADGFATFSREDAPFSPIEWTRLHDLLFGRQTPFELVKCGDTNEATSVFVHRLLLDGNPPTAPKPERAQALMQIIGGQAKLEFLERAIGQSKLMVRRAQAHILERGGFIARHRDSESSKHYVAAVVLQFRAADEGGDFVVVRNEEPTRLPAFSMLITHAELPHEVTPVLKGERRSLAFWLADASSPN